MGLFSNALPEYQMQELKNSIREAGKSDLQKEKELRERLTRELETELRQCKEDNRVMHQTLFDIYRYLQDHNYKFPVMLDEPTIKDYSKEYVNPDFVRFIQLPIGDIAKRQLQQTLKYMLDQTKKQFNYKEDPRIDEYISEEILKDLDQNYLDQKRLKDCTIEDLQKELQERYMQRRDN